MSRFRTWYANLRSLDDYYSDEAIDRWPVIRRLGDRVYLHQELQKVEFVDNALRLRNLTNEEYIRLYKKTPEEEFPSDDYLTLAVESLADRVHSTHGERALLSIEMPYRMQDFFMLEDYPAFLNLLSGLSQLREINLGNISLDMLQKLEESGCTSKVESLQTDYFVDAGQSPYDLDLMVQQLSKWKSLKSWIWKRVASN